MELKEIEQLPLKESNAFFFACINVLEDKLNKLQTKVDELYAKVSSLETRGQDE